MGAEEFPAARDLAVAASRAPRAGAAGEFLQVSTLDLEPEPDVDYESESDKTHQEQQKEEGQVKYTFKFGQDDKIEKIDDNETKKVEEKIVEPKEEPTTLNMFDDFEESVVVDDTAESEPEENVIEEEQDEYF